MKQSGSSRRQFIKHCGLWIPASALLPRVALAQTIAVRHRPAPAVGGIALGLNANTGNSGSGSCDSSHQVTTATVDTTGYTAVWVVVTQYYVKANTLSVADNKSNTFGMAQGWSTTNVNQVASIWRNTNTINPSTNVGTGHTVTVYSSDVNCFSMKVYLFGFTGTTLSDSYDNGDDADPASGTTIQQMAPVTPNAPNEYVIAVQTDWADIGVTATANEGFTPIYSSQATTNIPSMIIAGLLQTAAAPVQPTWQGTASTGRYCLVASVKHP